MANEIYNTSWWGNALDTARTAGTDPDFFGSQMKLLTSEQNRIVSFTNGTTYAFTTFTTLGNDITSAIVSSAFAGAVSNAISLKLGQTYRVTFDYTKNSGNDLRVVFSSSNNGAGAQISNNHLISESGSYSITLTVTSSGTGYLQMGTGTSSHSLNASIKNVRAELLRCDYDGLGDELVTNGDFASDSNWLKFNGATISNGVAELDNVSGSVIQQGITTEIGKTYNIKANITGSNNDYYLCVGTGVGTGLSNRDVLHSQNSLATFIATSTVSYVGVRNNSNNNTYTIDNVSVKEVMDHVEAKKCLADWIHRTALEDLKY